MSYVMYGNGKDMLTLWRYLTIRIVVVDVITDRCCQEKIVRSAIQDGFSDGVALI